MKTLTNSNGQKFIMSIPLVLSITQQKNTWFNGKDKLAVKCPEISNQIIAVIDDPQVFAYRKEEICARVFGT